MLTTISKGSQVTIPAAWRKELDLKAGTRVEMEKEGNSIVIRPMDAGLKRAFEEAKHRKPKYGMTAEEMDKVFDEELFR
ncbi:MAG: AbrB/MazE/SpoVT family DNA-binding domain-containing protein [Nanoarchaeota archaeon]